MPSLRCSMVNKVKNDEGLYLSLDLLEEKREMVAITAEKYKRKMEKYYNFESDGRYQKLGLNGEGPYEVAEALGDRANKL
ncbi:hypothetical protein Tco_0637597 [Tanacetum coccineum]